MFSSLPLGDCNSVTRLYSSCFLRVRPWISSSPPSSHPCHPPKAWSGSWTNLHRDIPDLLDHVMDSLGSDILLPMLLGFGLGPLVFQGLILQWWISLYRERISNPSFVCSFLIPLFVLLLVLSRTSFGSPARLILFPVVSSSPLGPFVGFLLDINIVILSYLLWVTDVLIPSTFKTTECNFFISWAFERLMSYCSFLSWCFANQHLKSSSSLTFEYKLS